MRMNQFKSQYNKIVFKKKNLIKMTLKILENFLIIKKKINVMGMMILRKMKLKRKKMIAMMTQVNLFYNLTILIGMLVVTVFLQNYHQFLKKIHLNQIKL